MDIIKDLKIIINTVLRNRGKDEIENLKYEQKLKDDLGFDSLDLAELTVRIESQYDVDVFADGIVETVREIVEKIENR